MHQQLLALVEQCFAERLPLPRRAQPPPSGGTSKSGGGSGGGADGSARDNLWQRAATGPKDVRFKRATQRRMLNELHEILHAYLVASINAAKYELADPDDKQAKDRVAACRKKADAVGDEQGATRANK